MTTQTYSMVDGFTLTINDPNGYLGANVAALVKDANYVIGALNTYLVFAAPLNLQIDVKPASDNSANTDGLLPSSPEWAENGNGQELLVGAVKGQAGVDLNGSTPDGGFTIYTGNDGTLKNYGSPLWFDPDPQLGVAPSFPSADADFVSIMSHELLHCLGFASWGAVDAAWNQHTYELNGVWYYKSPAIEHLLDGDLPLAPNETTGEAADHVGNTDLSYQPVTSDMMFEWGNYANNRFDFGQVDLTILQDLGWKIQNDQSLPLVDPIDSAAVTGTAGNDVLQAPKVSAIVSAGDGDDKIVLPQGAGNGNYLIVGGAGVNSVVVGEAYSGFDLVHYNSDYLLQNKQGLDGVSLLREIQSVVFSDVTIGIDATDANRTIVATAPGVVVGYDGAASGYALGLDGTSVTVADAAGDTDTLSGVQAIQFADRMVVVAAPPGQGAVTTGNVTELYSAVLAREPDASGLSFYQSYLAANPATPLVQFAEWFLSSSEYTGNTAHDYAQTSAGDQAFISDSYENLLHRTPSAAEISFYQTRVMAPALAGLAAGSQAYTAAQSQAHAQMLIYFSASAEFLADVQVTAQNPADAQHWLMLT